MTERQTVEIVETVVGLLGYGVAFAFGCWVATQMRSWMRSQRRARSARDFAVMDRVPVRENVRAWLRELARPTRTKLVILLVLFVVSVVADREGYLVLGEPGENPIPVVVLALVLRAVKLRVSIVIPPSEGPFTHQLPRK